MNAGTIECDRSVAVDQGEERPAGIITAAINIDRGRRCTVAAKNLNSSVARDGSAAGNVHVDGSGTADGPAGVIDLMKNC